MSSSVAVSSGSTRRSNNPYDDLAEVQKWYYLEKCSLHEHKPNILEMHPHHLLAKEVNDYSEQQMEDLIKGRTLQFHNVVGEYRTEVDEVKISNAPLAFYIRKRHIEVAMGCADCYCSHNFFVLTREFYDVIQGAQLRSLDVHVDSESLNTFEFLALTLPGSWCRKLEAINVTFEKEVYFESLAMLLKKSRSLSRLRISHNSGSEINAHRLICNMNSLEELVLNCPDKTGSGYYLDTETMDYIVELEKRSNGMKPFRTLKAFNATFEFGAEQFMKGCVALSKLKQNQMYEEYESLLDVWGRGGYDRDQPGNSISFEITPAIPEELSNNLFRKMMLYSKSYLLKWVSTTPMPRYYMIDNCMFRLFDYN